MERINWNSNNNIEIDGIEINDTIFQEELVDWNVCDLEDFIENLICWISEATKDKILMKNDLKYLITLNDDYIFSSVSTNDYIAQSDNLDEYNLICDEILALNKTL